MKFGFVEHPAAKTSRKFLNAQAIGELKVRRTKRRIQIVSNAFGAKDIQWLLAPIEMHGAEQPRNSVKMISMQMSDKNAVNAAALHAGAHQLYLRALAAIEQKHISIANHGGRRQ